MFPVSSFLVLLATASPALLSPVPPGTDLELLFVVHRHGDRAPLITYPTDPHSDESIWNNGLGQLTNEGKRQMYQLGKWLRQQYSHLIPEIYNDRDVYARATEITRDMMSASLVLAGLYEPTGTDVWHPGVKWQPIPVHATPIEKEYMLMSVAECPKMSRLMDELMSSEYVLKRFAEFAPTTEAMSRAAGYPDNRIVESIWLYDVFNAQSLHGLELPGWVRGVFPEPLDGMLAFLYRLHTHNDALKRFSCGPLVKEVMQSIDEKIAGNLTHKLREYAGHDQLIVDFMRCLNVDDGKTIPPYGAAVLLEVHRKGEDYFVAVKFKVDENAARELVIPGCGGELCRVETLRGLVESIVPNDWHKECHS